MTLGVYLLNTLHARPVAQTRSITNEESFGLGLTRTSAIVAMPIFARVVKVGRGVALRARTRLHECSFCAQSVGDALVVQTSSRAASKRHACSAAGDAMVRGACALSARLWREEAHLVLRVIENSI